MFSAVAGYKQSKTGFTTEKKSIDVKKIFPWFILLFVLSTILNTIGFIPASLHNPLGQISKFMMTMALSAIGLKTNFIKNDESRHTTYDSRFHCIFDCSGSIHNSTVFNWSSIIKQIKF